MTVSYDDAVREAKQLIDCLSPGNEIADLLQSLLAGPPEPSEPVAFGTGMLVIDTGRFNGAPAVFVADAKIGGPVGASSEKEGHANNLLQPGEWVLTFPTGEQAQRVADALVNAAPVPATEPSEEEVARVIARHNYGPHLAPFLSDFAAAAEVQALYRSKAAPNPEAAG